MSYLFKRGSCKLLRPIVIGKETIHKREWIQVTKDGLSVDLAPLPGLHQESLTESLNDFIAKRYRTPSALFVKEAFELFTEVQEVDVQSNKLLYINLSDDPENVAKSLEDKMTYKVKIGRANLESEKEWLNTLINNLKNGISLRLDGNLSFSLEDLNEYFSSLDLKKIQYVEEPLTDVTQWPKLDRACELKLALDENISLRRELDYASYIVAKPTWNISLKDTLKELAVENQGVIISSAFEPPNNIKLLKMLAGESEYVCGLDTLNFFDLESLNISPL